MMNVEEPQTKRLESDTVFQDELRSSGADRPTPSGCLDLIEQLPVALAVLDLEMRYLRVSPSFAFALGQAESDLLGKVHGDCVGDFPKGWQESYESVLQTGKSLGGEEAHFVKPSGKPERLRWELHPWRASEGATTGAILILEIMTRRKQFEALSRTSNKTETVAQLCGCVGTHLRNLFTILDGYAEKLVPPNASGMVETSAFAPDKGLREGISQGLELSEGLVTLGRNRTLDPRPTDLSDLLRDVVYRIRAQAPKNVDVAFVPREGIWRCFIDQTQLEKVVQALAENGLEAMPCGGTLTVSLVRSSERRLCFCIADSGDGMSELVIQKAIEPFFSTKGGGCFRGLGLSVAYGFITHSKGDLRIVSTLGVGTRIYVTVPFHDWSWQG